MFLEAIATKDDLVQALGQILPVRIDLGGEHPRSRVLALHAARSVELVADRGLRVVCSAELTWDIAGLSPTVKLDELAILLKPRVVDHNGGAAIDFNIELEEADIHGLPGIIDATIMKAANAALVSKKITWDVTESLSRTVNMGSALEEVQRLKISVDWAKCRITAEAFVLAASFKLTFLRSD